MGDPAASPLVCLAAERFLHEVRKTLRDEDKHRCEEFMKIVIGLKTQQAAQISAVKHKARVLFAGYPQLKEGFTKFLPLTTPEYRKRVRESLRHKKHIQIVVEFSKVLEDFESGLTDVAKVRSRLNQVFQDHPHLIDEFQSFIIVSATVYGNAVREYFKNRNEMCKYAAFVTLLRKHEDGLIDPSTLRKEVMGLFKNHRILLRGFNRFLPEYLCIPSFDSEEDVGKKRT